MTSFVKRLWAAAPVATALLVLALGAAALFGVRTAVFWAHRHERVDREQPVAAWMTPGYISHSWHVPPEVILDAIDAPKPPRKRMNLAEIAELNDTSVDTLIADTEAAIADWRATHPAPRDGRDAPDTPGDRAPLETDQDGVPGE